MGERIRFLIEVNHNEYNSTLKLIDDFDYSKFYYVINFICAENPEKYRKYYTDLDESLRNELWFKIHNELYKKAKEFYSKDLPDWKIKTEQLYNELIQPMISYLTQLVNQDFRRIIVPYFKEIGLEITEKAILDEKQGENALLIVNMGEG